MSDIAAKARAAVERLANTQMGLSLEEWGNLSRSILDAIAQPTPPDSERESLVQRLLEPCIDYDKAHIPNGANPRYEIACGLLREAATELTTLHQRGERLEKALRDICELEEELLITDQDTENEEHYHVFSDMPIGIAKAALEQST